MVQLPRDGNGLTLMPSVRCKETPGLGPSVGWRAFLLPNTNSRGNAGNDLPGNKFFSLEVAHPYCP